MLVLTGALSPQAGWEAVVSRWQTGESSGVLRSSDEVGGEERGEVGEGPQRPSPVWGLGGGVCWGRQALQNVSWLGAPVVVRAIVRLVKDFWLYLCSW